MLTLTQKKTAQAIVNIFETGSVLGDYGNVTLIRGDTGHLTFGRSQTTLGSGNLHELLQRYCQNPGARFATRLNPFLGRCKARDVALDQDRHLHNILRASADDPVMRETQDAFFDQVYWQKAERAAGELGITTPLGMAVVYDSTVHGSWERIRDRVQAESGSFDTLGEQAWIKAYIETRESWLANHDNEALHPTVYRMEAFRRLIEQNHWGLDLPLVVRGLEISTATLNGTPPGCYDGPQPGSRVLTLQTPLARGLDVRLVQLGLSLAGSDIKADGVYGQTSAARIKDFQQAHGLPATGVVDAALIAQLVA
ncbi:peptidoglycan-binding protein [Metapseudomonas boanensis]|uniref:Peptidoglycan-binding protein n=1 Tax=Metapseudomonas boanensis TaxID=2822138 RepID=A0ABS5XLG3_9GAMM|nr:peptidoglycan-binding protein [Pseudomonas boanensis]MBT8768535.1 peptidoglycan-binding protein [Pseudomonas boanensis]